MQDISLDAFVLSGALSMIHTVSVTEKELNQRFSLLEEAVRNSYYDDVNDLEGEIRTLMDRFYRETMEMDAFADKYGYKLFPKHEEKAILSGVK